MVRDIPTLRFKLSQRCCFFSSGHTQSSLSSVCRPLGRYHAGTSSVCVLVGKLLTVVTAQPARITAEFTLQHSRTKKLITTKHHGARHAHHTTSQPITPGRPLKSSIVGSSSEQLREAMRIASARRHRHISQATSSSPLARTPGGHCATCTLQEREVSAPSGQSIHINHVYCNRLEMTASPVHGRYNLRDGPQARHCR